MLGSQIEHAVHLVNQDVHAEVRLVELEAAFFNPREIKQVVHEMAEQPHLEVNVRNEIVEAFNAHCVLLILVIARLLNVAALLLLIVECYDLR